MIYKVIKASLDGISGGESRYGSIGEVLREVSYHRGWDSRECLHAAIRKWSEAAKPGDVFSTCVSAIIAIGVERSTHADDECTECDHEGMDYTEFKPVESGDIEQEVSCPACGSRWRDVFVIAERHEMLRVKS